MGVEHIASFITLGLLALVNLAAVAYSYGKLTQKVNDLCGRMSRLEKQENSRRQHT